MIVCGCRRVGKNELSEFIKGIGKKADEHGVEIKWPQTASKDNVQGVINFMRESNHDLVVVVLPRKDSHDYSLIKKTAELDLGIMTQCVLEKTVLKKDRTKNNIDLMTCGNILLKINHKIGGTNTRIHNQSRPTLFHRPTMVCFLYEQNECYIVPLVLRTLRR